jgi:hypothetical protein
MPLPASLPSPLILRSARPHPHSLCGINNLVEAAELKVFLDQFREFAIPDRLQAQVEEFPF